SAPPTYRPGMRVEVLMFDGVADMDATLPHDVFCRARLLGADVESVLVTSDGASEVTGCYGTRYAGLVGWTPEHADVLVVAGGWIERDADGPLPGRIAEAKRRGGDGLVLAGSDSGALYLRAAGLLRGPPGGRDRTVDRPRPAWHGVAREPSRRPPSDVDGAQLPRAQHARLGTRAALGPAGCVAGAVRVVADQQPAAVERCEGVAGRKPQRVARDVRDDEEPLVPGLAHERPQPLVVGHQQPERAGGDHVLRLPQRDQALVEGQHRVRVVLLRRHVEPQVVLVHRQPRPPGREAGLGVAVPLHRGARVVAAHPRHAAEDQLLGQTHHRRDLVGAGGLDVAVVLRAGERVVRHPDLLALVHERRALVQ